MLGTHLANQGQHNPTRAIAIAKATSCTTFWCDQDLLQPQMAWYHVLLPWIFLLYHIVKTQPFDLPYNQNPAPNKNNPKNALSFTYVSRTSQKLHWFYHLVCLFLCIIGFLHGCVACISVVHKNTCLTTKLKPWGNNSLLNLQTWHMSNMHGRPYMHSIQGKTADGRS